ncbi:MAG: hypothetical protein ACT6QM_05930 [Brevundimonas mediterranea]|uniref:hypothetical protein n=1 Tax=Brevundimonas mediterranea TaxID=74329 RepID=UPI004033AD6F
MTASITPKETYIVAGTLAEIGRVLTWIGENTPSAEFTRDPETDGYSTNWFFSVLFSDADAIMFKMQFSEEFAEPTIMANHRDPAITALINNAHSVEVRLNGMERRGLFR